MKWAFPLTSLISWSPSSSFTHSSSTSSSSCYPSTSPRISSNTVYSARRLMSSPSQSPRPGNGSPSNGSSRTWVTRMPQSVRCSSMHTENKSITPSEKACLSSSWSVSDRSGQPVVERVAKSLDRSGHPVVERGQELNTEHAQIRTLSDRQRDQILADSQAEIRRHKLQTNYDRRSLQKLSETIESEREEELHRVQAEGLHRRDQQLLHEQLLKQNWDLREASSSKVILARPSRHSTTGTLASGTSGSR